MDTNKRNNTPKFVIGDTVRVYPKEVIAQSLERYDKRLSCLFLDQILEYCGKEFKIRKVLNNFFDEYKNKMYRVRAYHYILDNLICNGSSQIFTEKCDRSCFLLWPEDWIEGTNKHRR